MQRDLERLHLFVKKITLIFPPLTRSIICRIFNLTLSGVRIFKEVQTFELVKEDFMIIFHK